MCLEFWINTVDMDDRVNDIAQYLCIIYQEPNIYAIPLKWFDCV